MKDQEESCWVGAAASMYWTRLQGIFMAAELQYVSQYIRFCSADPPKTDRGRKAHIVEATVAVCHGNAMQQVKALVESTKREVL